MERSGHSGKINPFLPLDIHDMLDGGITSIEDIFYNGIIEQISKYWEISCSLRITEVFIFKGTQIQSKRTFKW